MASCIHTYVLFYQRIHKLHACVQHSLANKRKLRLHLCNFSLSTHACLQLLIPLTFLCCNATIITYLRPSRIMICYIHLWKTSSFKLSGWIYFSCLRFAIMRTNQNVYRPYKNRTLNVCH